MDYTPQGYRRNVGVCLINPYKKIFAASRLDINSAWQMPQGGVNEGEDPRSAAIRELREDTGVSSVEIVAEVPYWLTFDFPPEVREKLKHLWESDWKGQVQKWFLVKFTGADEEINLLGDGTEKIRSEAKDLLGDDWVQRHRRIVQRHANQYKRNAWAKILQCLTIQGLTSSGGGSSVGSDGGNSSGVSRALVKDRFKTFNMQFEELHQKQSQWTVPDTELRESLRLAVAEVLLPAYRSFVKRFGPLVESGKNPQKYIKYGAEDLERMLGEFFEGKNLNESKR